MLAVHAGLNWRGPPALRRSRQSSGSVCVPRASAVRRTSTLNVMTGSAALDVLRAGVQTDFDTADAVLRLACLEWLRQAWQVGDLRRVGILMPSPSS
jgi:hypothetical protein